ncbi:STAS domain-containing protein [Alkalinema pantanalense CENA528]|uniref:STAS domain-containing protein n=1 Tax=Alkalinema pantanalense TaxID=1620705 RepID=UPI003D6E1605
MEATPDPTFQNEHLQFPETAQTSTIVLQPYALTGLDGDRFQNSLEQALQEGESVIVDLLWVDSVEDEALSLLLAGMQQALALNKPLSFLGMDGTTRAALDHLWEQQREQDHLMRDEVFTAEFESFLAGCRLSYNAVLEA